MNFKRPSSILDDSDHLNKYKLADHKLDGSESPTKVGNRERLEQEMKKAN